MNQMVSVFIPVHNVADQLEARVEGLLEVMSEASGPFDVWIIDDGSTDDTTQIAHDLARCYPQVRLLRHATRCGMDASIQTGLNHSSAETILVHTAIRPPSPCEMRELFDLREDVELVVVCDEESSSVGSPTWVDRLMGWGTQVAGPRGGQTTLGQENSSMRMIRRDLSRPIRLVKMGKRRDVLEQPSAMASQSITGPRSANKPSRHDSMPSR